MATEATTKTEHIPHYHTDTKILPRILVPYICSSCQLRGKGQNVQLQRNATWEPKGGYVCVPINRLAGRRRIYFCSNFHASYCLFIRSKISPILQLIANDNPHRLMKNNGERGRRRPIYLIKNAADTAPSPKNTSLSCLKLTNQLIL